MPGILFQQVVLAIRLCSKRLASAKGLSLTFVLAMTAFGLEASPQVTSPVNTASLAHPALVTFYSNGISMARGLPGEKSAAFKGRIFAEKQQLTFLEPAHFITFAFAPGPHEFTANTWMASGPRGGAHIKIDLAADKHYFIEARSRNIPVPSPFGIKEVTCSEARTFSADYKPLEPKHLRPAGKPLAIPEVVFPGCQ